MGRQVMVANVYVIDLRPVNRYRLKSHDESGVCGTK